MNRIWLSARLLMTGSWVVRISLVAFFLAAAGCLRHQTVSPMLMFFACLLAGIGYTSRCYLQSERRWLVPGMNETCAGLAIFCWALLSALGFALFVSIRGFFPECFGCIALALAFGLWLGMLEKSALTILILFYTIPLVAVSVQETSNAIGDAYMALPFSARFVVGLLLIAVALAVIARYWFVGTSKRSPINAVKTQNEVLQEGVNWSNSPSVVISGVVMVLVLLGGFLLPAIKQQSMAAWKEELVEAAIHCGAAFLVCVVLYAISLGLLRLFSTTTRSLSDVGQLMFGKSKTSLWRWLPWAVAIVFVSSFFVTRLFDSSGTDKAVYPKMAFALVVAPCVFSAFVIHGVSSMFSRMWITGLSESRTTTARALFLALVVRAMPVILIAFWFVLTLSMQTTTGLVPALLAVIASFAVGAAVIWLVARTYPWLARNESFVVVTCLVCLGGMIVGLVSSMGNIIAFFVQCESNLGTAGCVIASLLATAAIWIVCLWDASRSLGKSATFMEVSRNAFRAFAQ